MTEVRKVYLYHRYERLWHWVQALTFGLLFASGAVIHGTGTLPGLLPAALAVHEWSGLVLAVNALLGLLYHLATGEIRQFVPRYRQLFRGVYDQVRYYLHGIFTGAPHPHHKSPDDKLNPLQQLTYLGILNGLLPLQIVTGVLLWVRGQLPGVVDASVSPALVVSLHLLGAWVSMNFLIVHLYMTTTGVTLFASLEGMVTGWETLEGDAA